VQYHRTAVAIFEDIDMKKTPQKKSPAQGTAVGSGHRPDGGKIKTPTSAPSNPGTMDRNRRGSK
jgi:hypothetical protein